MQINIKAINAKLTPESQAIINSTINGLGKYFDNIIGADVEVGLNSLHHNSGDIYRVAVNLSVPKKMIRASAETTDITKSMNQVKAKLKKELIKYKEKL